MNSNCGLRNSLVSTQRRQYYQAQLMSSYDKTFDFCSASRSMNE